MYKGNKRESVLKEVWWVVCIIREAKVVGVRVWIMTMTANRNSLQVFLCTWSHGLGPEA